jgi:ribose 1,5-bisphosphokinase
MLPRRYITAWGEVHIEITPDEFQLRLIQGAFAMHWQSHGCSYGIGQEIDEWLESGFHVVLNGSRYYLEIARARYPTLCPILVRVSHDTLFER